MRPTVAAFRAAIAAQGVTVYAGGKVGPSPTLPYVTVHASTPTPSDYSHAAQRGAEQWRIATMYVASSEDSGMWLAEKVEAALLDKRLTIPGRACSKLKRQPGPPFRRDPDAETVVVTTDVWAFVTSAA